MKLDKRHFPPSAIFEEWDPVVNIKNLKIAAVFVLVILLIGALIRYAYTTRVETFYYTWYPGNSYAPARSWPQVSEQGDPKVVLVRPRGSIECFEIYYSKPLE